VEPNKNYNVPAFLKMWAQMKTPWFQHSSKSGTKCKLDCPNIPQNMGLNENYMFPTFLKLWDQNYMVLVESPKMQDQMKTTSFCSLSLAQHNQ